MRRGRQPRGVLPSEESRRALVDRRSCEQSQQLDAGCSVAAHSSPQRVLLCSLPQRVRQRVPQRAPRSIAAAVPLRSLPLFAAL